MLNVVKIKAIAYVFQQVNNFVFDKRGD